MLEFSYWLFPVIALVYILAPASREILLPGLVAGCCAGAANGVVRERPMMAASHTLAAAVLVCLYLRSSKKRRLLPPGSYLPTAVLCGWIALALGVAYLTPSCSWPYALDKVQMLWIFVPSLLIGSVIPQCDAPRTQHQK